MIGWPTSSPGDRINRSWLQSEATLSRAWAPAASSLIAATCGRSRRFRRDRLAARQHLYQRRDLPGAAGRRFHVVGAKDQREQVDTAKCPEGVERTGIGLDRGAQVLGNARDAGAADRGIGCGPAAVRLGGVHLALAVRRHASCFGQPRDVITVDLAPDAPPPPG